MAAKKKKKTKASTKKAPAQAKKTVKKTPKKAAKKSTKKSPKKSPKTASAAGGGLAPPRNGGARKKTTAKKTSSAGGGLVPPRNGGARKKTTAKKTSSVGGGLVPPRNGGARKKKPAKKKNRAAVRVQGTRHEPSVFLLVHLPASLSPLERFERYEEPIDDALAADGGLGEVTGGGSSLDDGGNVVSCDIEVEIHDVARCLPILRRVLKESGAPQGTVVTRLAPDGAFEVLDEL
jgi:hypothetical protein